MTHFLAVHRILNAEGFRDPRLDPPANCHSTGSKSKSKGEVVAVAESSLSLFNARFNGRCQTAAKCLLYAIEKSFTY